jgi:nitroreductase/FMN reductase [NAD(P)H]
MTDDRSAALLRRSLADRFGEEFAVDPALEGLDGLARLASRRVCRRYADRPLPRDLLRLLCACALSAPSKSDLQQADILVLNDNAKRKAIADLIPDMPWIGKAPAFLVFLANARRLPFISERSGKPFPNDHLDLFFNASVDAGIVLATFLRAAESVGLGCCPISVIRDHAATVSELLALPDRVIPVAGLCVGWPADAGALSPRLPLDLTLHEDRYDEGDLSGQIDTYDRRRNATRPVAAQRDTARWGEAKDYGWSEDKARQYAVRQRGGFGAFVRGKGFRLD